METSLSPQAADLDVQVSFAMQHLNMNFSIILLTRLLYSLITTFSNICVILSMFLYLYLSQNAEKVPN
jgi:hypothetical protein